MNLKLKEICWFRLEVLKRYLANIVEVTLSLPDLLHVRIIFLA